MNSKIDQLLNRIKELEQENEELRSYNKRLFGQEENSTFMSTGNLSTLSITIKYILTLTLDVHSFYQDVFITDLNKEIYTMNEEADGYKKQLSEQGMTIEKLHREVQHLNKVLNRYRTVINEFIRKDAGVLKHQNLQKLNQTLSKFHRPSKCMKR